LGSRGVSLALAAIVLAATMVLAGCAAVPEPDVAVEETTTTAALDGGITPEPLATGPARPSPGCSSPTATGPFDGPRSLPAGEGPREVLLHVPGGLGPTDPVPLVLDMHGLGTNAALQSNVTAWNALADRERFVVVHPQGLNNIWNLSTDESNPDLRFLRSVVTTLAGERCIDLRRVYATGLSMGGLVASVLACRAGDMIAAFGLVAGMQWKPECAGAPPRPAIVFWGTLDCVLPYFGGTGPCLNLGAASRPQPTGPVPPGEDNGFPPVEDVVAAWAAHNGCGAVESQVAATRILHRAHRGCRESASVEFYLIDGGSHSWPGSAVMAQLDAQSPQSAAARGTTTTDIDATALMWAFFQRHQLPA
jgi:polyhydroxybutyrate depolymerase